jgi:uncharacterized protein (DUF1684 family)
MMKQLHEAFRQVRKGLIMMAVTVCSIISADAGAQSVSDHRADVDAWHARRVGELKSENGWINLAGLYWLEEGANRFGSGSQNDLIFPQGTIPAKAGVMYREGDRIRIVAEKGVGLAVDGRPVKKATVFHPDSSRSPVISYGSLRWTIIKRGERTGVRLRDLNSPNLKDFRGVERYPVDTAWRIPAILVREGNTGKLAITNVLGQTTEQPSPGQLRFKINGQACTLDALEEGGELFIIFSDATSGEDTYPSGRFLYAAMPGADGRTWLELNKAINPPCAFTPYATCPLPPRQNRLRLAVTAGEKYRHQ